MSGDGRVVTMKPSERPTREFHLRYSLLTCCTKSVIYLPVVGESVVDTRERSVLDPLDDDGVPVTIEIVGAA